jgi:hypothetical protein
MTNRNLKLAIIGFLGGAISVLLFHQVVVLILHLAGVVPFAPYSFKTTLPLGVPQVLSSAFWGGLWGIALAFAMDRLSGANRLWVALLFGALLPTLVAAVIVTPLKGGDMTAWMNPQRIAIGFAVNGAWGLGAGLFYRLARPRIA